ncbi:Hypothetical predicted protein, partial [Paramuricea clavata]
QNRSTANETSGSDFHHGKAQIGENNIEDVIQTQEEQDSAQDDDQLDELDPLNEDDQFEELLRRYEPVINAGHRLHPRQAVYNFRINDNLSFD